MEQYKEKQYDVEDRYINNTYFKSFEPLSLPHIENEYFISANVLLKDIPYDYLIDKYNTITLIPKKDDLFKGDFDNIYEYRYEDNKHIYLYVISKKDGIIERYLYQFFTSPIDNMENCVESHLYYGTLEDKENNLYKHFKESSGLTKHFLYEINNLIPEENQKSIIVRKYENGIYKRYLFTSPKELLLDMVNKQCNFEVMDMNPEESIMKASLDIVRNSGYQKVKKTNKKHQ